MNEQFNRLATYTTQSLAHMVVRKNVELESIKKKCAELESVVYLLANPDGYEALTLDDYRVLARNVINNIGE